MTNFDYKKYKDVVNKEMYALYGLVQIHHSFVENLEKNIEFTKNISGKMRAILLNIRNSLVVNICITLRRILSTDSRDCSLPNLYEKIFEPEIKSSESRKDFLLKKVLPNHFGVFNKVMKYVNKNLAHTDKEIDVKAEQFSWQEMKSIFDDLQKTFDCITLKKEDAQYFLDEQHVKLLADRVFKMMASEIPTQIS